MKSLFAETKIYFDQMFSDNWCDSEIHYAGEEFNSDGLNKWINIFYQPAFGASTDLCESTLNNGNLHVVVWAEVYLDAMELSDDVISFVDTYIDKNLYRVRRFEISDHGFNESNNAFIIVTFSIEAIGR